MDPRKRKKEEEEEEKREKEEEEENGRIEREGAEGTYVLGKIYIHVTVARGRRKEEACMGHLRDRGMGEKSGSLSNKPILLRRASRVYLRGARE